jgi:hypothetical protein
MKACFFATMAVILGLISIVTAAEGEAPASDRGEGGTFAIHPKVPPFTYRILKEKSATGVNIVSINISGGPRSYTPQTLDPWMIRGDEIETIDLNLDGYKDIRVLIDVGNRGDEIRECWLYDPKRKRFTSAPEFDMIDEVYPKEGLLVSYASGGVAYSNESWYRLKNGIPEIDREVETAYAENVRDIIPSRYPDGSVVRITRLYRNGRLARTFHTRKVL